MGRDDQTVEGGREMSELAGRSTRVDSTTGITEHARFLGPGPERILGITYLPRNAPAASVVMCEPILSQFRSHYRVGTLTARALAAAGVAVQRFQYRGMGNSDGDVSRMTLDSMTEDAALAADTLTKATAGVSPVYLGINVGAYPAATLSADGRPLILDSPPLSGRAYFRAAFRAHGIYAMKEGAEKTASGALMEELNERGLTSMLGCRLSIGLYESLSERSLEDALGAAPRKVLVVAPGSEGELRADMRQFTERLAEAGFDLDVEIRPKEDPFWFVVNSAPEDRPETGETALRIADWARAATAAGSLNGASPA